MEGRSMKVPHTAERFPTCDEPRGRTAYDRDLDVAFASMMVEVIARRDGVGSPQYRAAVGALDVAREVAS